MSLAPLPPEPKLLPAPRPVAALAMPSLNGSPRSAPPEIGDGPTRKFPIYLVLAAAGWPWS